MFEIFYISLLPLVVFSAQSDVTFKNVEFKGYSVYTLKFTKSIEKSDSLKENIPSGSYDHLEFLDQSIPVLRENSISDIEDLDELTIENCKLKEILPGAFKDLPLLRRLSLKGNKLEEIKAGVFNNLPLSMLDISENRISSIEATALDNLPNVLNINLADNFIAAWNNRWFHNTPLLTRISMQNNSLEKIPTEAFINLREKKNYNSLKLTLNLIFSYNKIRKIDDGGFKGLEEINNLWLDNNNLIEFKDDLLADVEVENLRIENNELRCLTGNLSKIIIAERTNVDGNPFDCECLNNIKKWATDHNKNVEMFFSEMSCSAERMRRKMDDLEKRLKEVKGREEIEESNSVPHDISDEIEMLN